MSAMRRQLLHDQKVDQEEQEPRMSTSRSRTRLLHHHRRLSFCKCDFLFETRMHLILHLLLMSLIVTSVTTFSSTSLSSIETTQTIYGVVGGKASLPCNITAPTADDAVSLILWYKEDSTTPIYRLVSSFCPRRSKPQMKPHDWRGCCWIRFWKQMSLREVPRGC